MRVTPTPLGGGKGEDHRDEEQDLYLQDEEHGFLAWARRRWWAVALIVLLACGVIVAVVVGPICGIRGCPVKHSQDQAQDPGPPRLIVKFRLPDIDALSVLPALLQNYTSRLNLTSSYLQILDFVDEATLQEAMKYLMQNTDLVLLTRDFVMAYNPNGFGNTGLAPVINNQALAAAGLLDLMAADSSSDPSTGSRRKLQQVKAVSSNDPFIKNGTQWHHSRIKSQLAWATTPGDASVVVAVIDSGVDLTHPDLQKQLWVNKAEVAGDGLDNDGNSYVDDVNGYDFAGGCSLTAGSSTCTCVGRATPLPANMHGTHVAGLIAASVNNTVGGAGAAPNVKLMVLRVADCQTGAISAAAVAQALDYAYRMGAHIVSMSLGSSWAYGADPRAPPVPGDTRWSDWQAAYTEAIRPLANKNVLVVAAAGNEDIDLDNLVNLNYTYVPCVVPLNNVLCVGASDLSDGRAYFSNYGATQVDVSSPGVSVLSTLWQSPSQHVYGMLDGSSMSTPIVSGIAALVASVLGARDKNFTQAVKIKQLLMDSGDIVPALAGQTLSGKRINAYSAISMAIDSLTNDSYIPKLNRTSAPTSPPGVLRVNGFLETYWTNTNPLVLDVAGQTQMDESVRGGGPKFINFKCTSGCSVNMSASLLVNVSGIHTFTLSYPSQYLGGKIQVNGVTVGLKRNGNSAVGAFQATAAGWYSVSFTFIPIPASVGAVQVLLTPPGGTAGLYPTSYQTWPSAAYVPPTVTNNYSDPTTGSWGFNAGWWVFMNKTDPITYNASTMATLFQNVQQNKTWQQQLAAPFDSLTSDQFRAALLPGDSSTSSVTGIASTYWNTTGMPSSFMFTVTCKGCGLSLNGRVVVDSWETFSTALAASKTSSCITITPGTFYLLQIKFATTLSPNSPGVMMLKWSACTGGTSNSLTGTSLSPAVIDMSYRQAASYIGWIGGVQCDVWKAASGATTVPATNPLYKVRLPRCASPETALSSCSTPWSFTLDQILPGGLAAATPAATSYSVRCWAYANSSSAVPTSTQLTTQPAGVISNLWYGGLQQYAATKAGVSLTNLLPQAIRYGNALQQLTAEWVAVGPTQVLSVLSGTTPLAITPQNFRLPIWTTADNGQFNPSAIYDPNLKLKPIGAGGLFLQAYLANSADVGGLVAQNPAAVASLNSTVATSAQGLFGPTITPPSAASLANKVWYANSEGYYYVFGYSAGGGWASLVFDEPPGSSTMLLAGDVVIRNAPAFSPTSPAAPGVSVDVYLPPGYLRMRVVTKAQNSTGTITYSIQAEDDGVFVPFDQYTWFRTAWQPQTP